MVVAGPRGIEPRTYGLRLDIDIDKDFADFRDFLLTDDQKSKTTARDYSALVKRFLRNVENPITIHSLRNYEKS